MWSKIHHLTKPVKREGKRKRVERKKERQKERKGKEGKQGGIELFLLIGMPSKI